MGAETPEEFWLENIKQYKKEPSVITFPEKLIVTQLFKMANKDVAVFKGCLKNNNIILISYPTCNKLVKNFIAVGIAESEYRLDDNTEIYPLDFPNQMNDDFLFSLLVESYGWCIKDYGDLSQY